MLFHLKIPLITKLKERFNKTQAVDEITSTPPTLPPVPPLLNLGPRPSRSYGHLRTRPPSHFRSSSIPNIPVSSPLVEDSTPLPTHSSSKLSHKSHKSVSSKSSTDFIFVSPPPYQHPLKANAISHTKTRSFNINPSDLPTLTKPPKPLHKRHASLFTNSSAGKISDPYFQVAKESLPPYHCSITKAGYLFRKVEMVDFGIPSSDRKWRKIYFVIWGTCLKVYKKMPKNQEKDKPELSLGMQYANIGPAPDYLKKKYVFRVQIQGYQFLLRATSSSEVIQWIDALQASANIANPIEHRRIPKFTPVRRRHRRVASHT